MDLDNAGLTGDIPQCFGRCCPNLKRLALKNNPKLGGRDALNGIHEARASALHPDDASKFMTKVAFGLD
jgi:hypothetical protein